MLVSVVEPILRLISNPLFAFVFCNLIVLVIFLRTRFDSTADSGTRYAMLVFDVERFSSYQIVRPEKYGEEKLELGEVTEVCNGEIQREEENEDNIIESEDENQNKNENNDEEEEEEDGEEVNDDDEDDNGDYKLRERIEGFIAKVIREWEEENLKERMHQLTLLNYADAPNKQMHKIDQNGIDIPRTEQLHGEEVNDDDEDDKGDYKLRGRIEGFISKVIREWEAENLKERMYQQILLDCVDAANKQMHKMYRNGIDIPRTEQLQTLKEVLI